MKLYDSREWLYKRYVIEKKGIVNMAKEAGCSHMTIQRALEKKGIIDMAKEAKCSHMTIQRALDKHKIIRVKR